MMKATGIKQHLLIGLIALFSLSEAQATKGIVIGMVIDAQNQPIEYATAALINTETNEIEKGTMCDEEGTFTIDNVACGEYVLSVRMLGYESNESERVIITSSQPVVNKTIVLTPTTRQIDEVVVTGKYAFVEQTAEKIIVNPNASITSSSESIYDILKKSPGVMIDNNDNISLKGMQGVIIMIDDKPTHVSGEELAPMLKGMQGKQVKAIEIIENPSARYDAEGSAGIINIKTRHDKAPGFNGNVNAGVSFARTMGGNAGAAMNLNIGKVNVYGNYGFYNRKGLSRMEGTRRFTNDVMEGGNTLMSNESNTNVNAHHYKVGADYYLAKNHVVSIMLNGNKGSNDMLDNGLSAFRNVNAITDSSVSSITDRIIAWDNKTFNANYKWDIDSLGGSFTADADYARFNFRSSASQSNTFYDADGGEIDKEGGLTSALNNAIDIFSARLDYTRPISETYALEAGIKSSFVEIGSKASMAGYTNQDDHFLYTEKIQAGYVSGSARFESTTLQVGARVENTISNGNSVSTGQVDENRYLNVFPSLFIQQTLTPKQSLGFRYSYRIGRPNYHELNPFVWMMDPYTYNLGNPLLQPQFTHAMSLHHSFEGKLVTNIGLNRTEDLLTEVIYQDEASKSAYQTMENFGNSTDFNVSETVQLQPLQWWRMTGTTVVMYKAVNARESIGDALTQWSFTGHMNNSFTLPYGMNLEVNGKYVSRQLFGNIIMEPHYVIDLGLQVRVLKDKGTIRASFSDILNTSSAGVYSKYGNLELDMIIRNVTRRLDVSFNYRFGKSEFKTRADRATASSEEQSRSSN
jgi:hypothetical protein